MRFVNWIVALILLAGLAGCNIDSSVVLPPSDTTGDAIAGFPADKPFALEAFDRQKAAFHVVGTVTPSRAESGAMRYTFALNENAYALSIRAKKLSDNNYVLRYTETDASGTQTGQTSLVFMTLDDGTYFVLASLADKAMVDKIFADSKRPDTSDMQITLTSDAQADVLSRYFRDHRGEFVPDQGYIRLRIAK